MKNTIVVCILCWKVHLGHMLVVSIHKKFIDKGAMKSMHFSAECKE